LYWEATYRDGRKISEATARYSQLQDRDQLLMFTIFDENNRIKAHLDDLQDGRKLFYRARVFGVGSPRPTTIILVGYRKRALDNTVQTLFYRVPEFGQVTKYTEFSGDCYEPKPWYPEEEV
jgi:hypothetical protein